jgi:hypothetical protein
MTIPLIQNVAEQLSRAELSEFLSSPRAIATFENFNSDSVVNMETTNQAIGVVNSMNDAPVVTTASTTAFNNEHVLTGSADIGVNVSAGLAGISLNDTTVVSGTYGDASHVVKVTVDSKGRATAMQSYALNSDNVAEGGVNLFFTNARARTALSGGTGISYNSGTGVIAFSATPAANGTYTPVTSITIVNGIITAIS